jgi:ATP citrate (pro-S)-lyase
MSAKAVREYHGKKLLAKYVEELSDGKHVIDSRSILVTSESDWTALAAEEPWLLTTPLVV